MLLKPRLVLLFDFKYEMSMRFWIYYLCGCKHDGVILSKHQSRLYSCEYWNPLHPDGEFITCTVYEYVCKLEQCIIQYNIPYFG